MAVAGCAPGELFVPEDGGRRDATGAEGADAGAAGEASDATSSESASGGGEGGDSRAGAPSDAGSSIDTPDGGGGGADSASPEGGADSSDAAGHDGVAPTTDAGCASQGIDCFDCCQIADPAGIDEYIALVQACVCGDAGPCESVCATEYCANGSVSSNEDPCSKCVSTALAGPCSAPANGGCAAEPACAAYLGCASGCR